MVFPGVRSGANSGALIACNATGALALPEMYWSPAPRAALGAHVALAIDNRTAANVRPRSHDTVLRGEALEPPVGEAWRDEGMTLPSLIDIFPNRRLTNCGGDDGV